MVIYEWWIRNKAVVGLIERIYFPEESKKNYEEPPEEPRVGFRKSGLLDRGTSANR
jgi:hypothetical protein